MVCKNFRPVALNNLSMSASDKCGSNFNSTSIDKPTINHIELVPKPQMFLLQTQHKALSSQIFVPPGG